MTALPAYRYRDPADVVDQMRAEERRRSERLAAHPARLPKRPGAKSTELTEEDLKYVPKIWLR